MKHLWVLDIVAGIATFLNAGIAFTGPNIGWAIGLVAGGFAFLQLAGYHKSEYEKGDK